MLATKELWVRNTNERAIDQIILPQTIAESWQYCRQHNVSPYLQKGQVTLDSRDYNVVKQDYQFLIELVRKEIMMYLSQLKLKRPLFVLTDNEGCVIWRDGHQETIRLANQITFREGTIWTEKTVGTNAIGLALRRNQGTVVQRYEHFSLASHNFNCASMPLCDYQGKVIGCLNISSFESDSLPSEILLTLQMISLNIQEQLLRQHLALEAFRGTYYLKQTKRGIMCDQDHRILEISPSFELKREEYIGKKIGSLVSQLQLQPEGEEIIYEGKIAGYFYAERKYLTTTTFQLFGAPSRNESYLQFIEQLKKVAPSNLNVHIFGESGSGKEGAAKMVHYNSLVKDGPLISLNCGALSENLLESELFGYAKGAFTGAQAEGYRGKIQQATKGTLFLDEVDSMSPRMQAALLRVLEDKQVTPLGSEVSVPVEFRLVTASNQDLRQLVQQGKFRHDLYYRLYVVPLTIPPLRERSDDFASLITNFCEENQWSITWQEKIIKVASDYQWEGNIREFINFLERLALFYREDEPSEEQIRQQIQVGSLSVKTKEPNSTLTKDEASKIKDALVAHNYHLTQTAQALGMARSTLYRKMKQFKIEISN